MTPLIAVHAFAAATSVLLGAWQIFVSRKGSPLHRFTGRVWVVLMLFVAISSFWIREVNDEGRWAGFSWLHILSVVTLVTVTLGFVAARRGNVEAHRGNMIGSWIGLTTAGTFAVVIRDRDLPTFAVDQPGQTTVAAAAVLITAVGVIVVGRVVAARMPA